MRTALSRPIAALLVLALVSGSFGVAAQTGAGGAASASPSAAAAAAGTTAPASSASSAVKTPASAAKDAKAAKDSPAGKDAGKAGAGSAATPAGPVAEGAGSAPSLSPPAPATKGRTAPRRGVSALPPPTPAQLKALDTLQKELGEYQAAAKDYRSTLTMIVRHHYDEKRRRVLSTLDREIGVEQKALADARDEAIRRLEQFIETYSGTNANQEATPDAMYRLAALYEERARADFEGDLSKTLKPAIDLYRRIITEYPKYEELAGVFYFLGHAYTDSSRLAEGQQAWRALVCVNQYPVQTDPTNPDKIALTPLPQDHDEKFWNDWYNRHPVPLDQVGSPGTRKKYTAAPAKGKAGITLAKDDDELRFKNPYPDTCEPVAQQIEPGAEPKYVGEVWWQIGNYHFDQVDVSGGPYELNRGMSAYEHSMKFQKPPLYGVAMYKRAWTYFKQQRYKTAVQWFVSLLHYADEQEAKTGDPGADFRQEAYTYVAGSLTYVDFDGPPADAPNIPRNDVLDVETNPVVAEDKMKIAIDRVQDPALIPQDKKWTVEIYKALAQEFIEITQNRNAIAVLELTLKKFPMDRDAPKMQNKVAELYDQLTKLALEGSAVRAEYGSKALEARTKLAAYVGTTPWTDANR
ncbi:MAG TPA: tetratricopeptide repeat protein, partial [Polyangiaceae bacterium]